MRANVRKAFHNCVEQLTFERPYVKAGNLHEPVKPMSDDSKSDQIRRLRTNSDGVKEESSNSVSCICH